MKLSNFALSSYQEKAEDPIDRNFGIINNFFMSLECKGFNPDQVPVKYAWERRGACNEHLPPIGKAGDRSLYEYSLKVMKNKNL